MRNLIIGLWCVLGLLSLVNGACTGRFCESGTTFKPYNYYRILEGDVAPYQLGFFRMNYVLLSSPIDPYVSNQCGSNKYQAELDSIQAIQLKNDWDPYLSFNAYTYNFDGITWTTAGSYQPSTYKYLTTLVGTYEGCLLTLSWNRIYDVSNSLTGIQVLRTTYTMKTHTNFVHNTATEFYSTNTFPFTVSGTPTMTYATAKDKFWSPCRMFNKYYWHPYKNLYFFMDTESDGSQSIVFTCFPYNTGPNSACDSDFNTAGTPKFRRSVIKSAPSGSGIIDQVHEFVTFTRGTAYVAVRYYSGGTSYKAQIRKLIITGTDCNTYSASISASPVYSFGNAASTRVITGLTAIPNVGLGFTRQGNNGIYIVSLNSAGDATNIAPIETTTSWKLFQLGIDSTDEPPLFAVAANQKDSIYRVTNIISLVYQNNTLNFYDYPGDVGRFHFMAIYPGGCHETLATTNYDKVHALYINLEEKIADFCVEDVPKGVCGNGILDPTEECDDGNNRDNDGCSATCTIEPRWRCYNSPYNTRSLCEQNECGDGFINTEAPEYEVCDDGNWASEDGCTSDCRAIEKGWYCGRPGQDCVHVCSNSKVDDIPGPPYNLYAYKEACDDGNEVSGDGCSGDCMTIEPGYECPTPGELCRKICGNGEENPGEECDDGNKVSGDGCSADCKIEYGYKFNGWGNLCKEACGDGIVDNGIPGHPGYVEQCDDGILDSNYGCDSNCNYIAPARGYPYPDPVTLFTKEVPSPPEGSTTGKADCRAPYLPAQVGTQYNPAPPSMVCYKGLYCFDCTQPKFPGYQGTAPYSFVDMSPYKGLPHRSRGRLRALHWGGETYAFTFVANNKEVLISDAGREEISHGGVATMRQSLGRYFVMSSGTSSFKLYRLEKDMTDTYKLIEKAFTLTKPVAPQLGAEFYIWWPGPNYLLSRSYNGRNFEVFSLHENIYDAIDNPNNYPEDSRIDGPYLPDLNMLGDILFDPVFRNNNMYIPLYTSSFEASPTIKYKVNIYGTPKTPWEITLIQSVVVANKIISMASFEGAVIATTNAAGNQFYNIDAGSNPLLEYTSGTAPTCSLDWKFIQARPNPDVPNNSPPAYAYCNPAVIYPVTYTSAGNKLTIDTTNAITLPDDQRTSQNKNGRFNLAYPYDISGDFLINFAIHKCSDYKYYRWDEWHDMSVSVYNLNTKTSSCIDINNGNDVFE